MHPCPACSYRLDALPGVPRVQFGEFSQDVVCPECGFAIRKGQRVVVGSTVAAAVGDRLKRLSRDMQVLVVTQSPQVAARGDHHWRVSKTPKGTVPTTKVEPLTEPARREEIARMLAGAEITDAARAAADALIEGARV